MSLRKIILEPFRAGFFAAFLEGLDHGVGHLHAAGRVGAAFGMEVGAAGTDEAVADGHFLVLAPYGALLRGTVDLDSLDSPFHHALDELVGEAGLVGVGEYGDAARIFDEADGLLSARKTSGANSDSTNLIKSHLLNILDRSNAIVIFTTNFFKSYDRAFVRRILWNIEVPAPGIPELTQIWALHLGRMIPKDISYEELAQISFSLGEKKNLKITGGDVKKLTLMLCTKLTSGRINAISREVVGSLFEKYLDDLQESKPIKESEVIESELPKPVKELLKD